MYVLILIGILVIDGYVLILRVYSILASFPGLSKGLGTRLTVYIITCIYYIYILNNNKYGADGLCKQTCSYIT